MCGIAGIAQYTSDKESSVKTMLSVLVHRGPDQTGIFIRDECAFGHQRLSIVDLQGGRQPRVDHLSGDALIFNGEIYGYRQLATGFLDLGIPLRDGSDTEVLFQMLRYQGVEKTLQQIDGMFAFAYREGKSGRVWLVRDRFGEKPIYWGRACNGGLVFASELKAVKSHHLFSDVSYDYYALNQYLGFDYIPAPRTIYQGISKLRAGHLLVWHNGEVEEKCWWRPRFNEAILGGPISKLADDLDVLLNDSIRSRLVADVPVGIFLSGGIDSSIVAAIASAYAPGLKAFTISFSGASYDETPYAKVVAERYGLDHQIVELGNADILTSWEALSAHLDEPFADASILPTWLLCRTAKQQVTVALGGDGADELFAGYPNFPANHLSPLVRMIPLSVGRALRRAFGCMRQSGSYMSLQFKLRQLSFGFGHPDDQQSFRSMASFSPEDRTSLLSESFMGGLFHSDPYDVIDNYLRKSHIRDPMQRLQYLFITMYLADNILVKMDRASMFHSLEVRSPFLDNKLASFALALPFHYKLSGMTTKKILKVLAARYLPDNLIYRTKHGFAPPVSEMLRGPLLEPMCDLLLSVSNPLSKMFSLPELERMINEHTSRRADNRKSLWNLLQLFAFTSRIA